MVIHEHGVLYTYQYLMASDYVVILCCSSLFYFLSSSPVCIILSIQPHSCLIVPWSDFPDLNFMFSHR